ncbi:hypothetical protein Osc7112_4400 [Oscillatoria nigro-viridis PCC 7112]|uniref:Uncharacterized protein n=1 Tax=Phormidium nigroviride PCC 7112 TaxID=179408 RepID=K9VKT3_9CYAN|nr:hypothetical protein Osc7112_4400 [Oscillatoria nigro-viridis PCC 7112]
MLFKRPSRWRGLVSTDREPSRFNLYCPLSRIIYAGADDSIYLQVYSPLIRLRDFRFEMQGLTCAR